MLYEVRALGAKGRLSLAVEAIGEAEAVAQARSQGYRVLAVGPHRTRRLAWLGRRKTFPLLLFSRELMALLGSGLTLTEALETLAEKDSRAESRQILDRVVKHLYEGERFSAAIAHFPDAFPTLYISAMHAAEKTSSLTDALGRYIAYQEQVDLVKSRVVSAALYPMLLLGAGGLVALFLIGYVTPRFATIYEGNLANVPAASKLLIALGGALEQHGTMIFVSLLVLAGLAGWGLSRPAARARFSRWLWRMPGLGERLRIFQLTRFYRTVAMLQQGGIPIVAALEMAESLLHPELRLRLQGAVRRIREGQSLSQAMTAEGLSTPVADRLLRVGEKSGRMGEMLESVATFHDEEQTRFVDWFMRLVEPLLMVMIGLVIGVLVVLLYLPIFDLAGSLD